VRTPATRIAGTRVAGNHPGPADDYPTMTCDEVRVALSARIDGESTGVAAAALDAHLAGCAGCAAWQARAEEVTRAVRVQAVRVPDLTARVLAAVAADPAAAAAGRPTPGGWQPSRAVLRAGLALTALAQVLLALPVLLSAGELHASREMACFEVALAVGFALAAWRPERARVFVPVAAVLAAGLALTSVFDMVNSYAVAWHEAGHLAAVVQAGLLWALARSADSPPAGTVRARAASPA
jgi:predicted anti-sigma-YlaC factor YlaD